jgi:hypothetical protein
MEKTNSGFESDRRNVLKLVGSGGVVAGIVGMSGVGDAGPSEGTNDSIYISGDETTRNHAYAKQEHQYDIKNNDWYRLDSVIECYGGNPTDDPDYDWENHFRIVTAGAARRYDPDYEQPGDGKRIDTLTKNELNYNLDGPGNMVIDLATDDSGEQDPIGVAGWPVPTQTLMEATEAGIEAVAEILISDYLGPKANFLLDFKQVYEEISSNKRDETTSFGTSQFVWEYGRDYGSDKHSDICHAVKFSIQLNHGESTTNYWDTTMYDKDLDNYVNWRVDCEAPSDTTTTTTTTTTDDGGSGGGGSGGSGDTTTTTDDGGGGCGSSGCLESLEQINGMSKQERKRWGLRRVPVEKLRNAGVPVKNPAQFPDGTTWYATSPPVTLTDSENSEKSK